MFRKSKLTLFAFAVLGLPAFVIAAPTNGVKYTPHNLSTSNVGGNFFSNNESEICVFCHTPHNATGGGKWLWNRLDSTATFVLYTASDTLNFTKGVSISAVSKMCMSCHDGGTAFNSMANPPQPAPTWAYGNDQIGDIWDDNILGMGWGPNLGEGTGAPSPGGNLTNDHPISFLYSESCNADAGIKKADGGTCSGTAVGGLPLWNGKVECTTCHDPHINYNPSYGGDSVYKPFLRADNTASALCLTCHNK